MQVMAATNFASSEAATSKHVVAPTLALPSMTTRSIPLFECLSKLNEKNTPSPLDYIENDSEQVSRQTAANARIRALLKGLPKSRGASINQAPEYITIKAGAPPQISTPIVSDSSLVPRPSEASISHHEAHEKRSRRVQLQAAADENKDHNNSAPNAPPIQSENIPSLGSEDPPWMLFLGHRISKATKSPLTNWKEFLSEMHRHLDFFGHLHEEICALMFWLDPTPEELLLRQRALARVTLVAKALWPECEVRSFGSYYTGLWLPNGDLDVCIMNVEGDAISNLRILTLCLNRLGIPLAVEIISSARVPIVKYVDSESGIPIDTSLNTESALTTSEYVVENLKKYPWLRPLILLVKLYLQQRGLNETYKGGVGSYLLFVLCLSFLQHHKVSSSKSLMKNIGLGHLLFDFLQLYGRDFNYDTTGISVLQGGCYFVKTRGGWFNPDKPSLLAVESPLATELDLGRNSYDIRTVRNSFRQSFVVLTEHHFDWKHSKISKNRSILNDILFSSDPLLKNRIRYPARLPTTLLKETDWWSEVSSQFNQPIGASRLPPLLPKPILKQVMNDLEKEGGIEKCIASLQSQFSRRPNYNKKRERSCDVDRHIKRPRPDDDRKRNNYHDEKEQQQTIGLLKLQSTESKMEIEQFLSKHQEAWDE